MAKKSYEGHPGYGMISFNRVSGKSNFFGSNLQHDHFVELEITQAEVKTEYGREWYYSKDNVISVRMTQLQFSELLTTMNSGGVPCTIQKIGNEKIESIPKPKTIKKVIIDEISLNEREFLNDLEMNRMLIEEALDNKRLKADEKSLIKSMMSKVVQHLTKNRLFYEESIGERIDKGIIEAKQEVEASIQQKIHAAGLEHLGVKAKQIDKS